MSPPRLLILRRLLEPSRRAQNALEEIEEKLPGTASDSIELRGLFVLMVSALETMVSDTYVYYLRSFPEAFDFKDVKFSKDDILEANLALDLIERQVEKNAISQAYDSLPELLRTFTKALGITDPPLDAALIDRVVEVKETRNVLLHNNLLINRRYALRAGQFRREGSEGSKLALTQAYADSACQDLRALIQELQARMSVKYGSFTKLAAVRRLWDYLFSSPIMAFDEFWVTDVEKDEVCALKESRWEKQLSSSEHAFLAVWRVHFNGWKKPSDAASMYGLDTSNRTKMLWFLATLADFDVR